MFVTNTEIFATVLRWFLKERAFLTRIFIFIRPSLRRVSFIISSSDHFYSCPNSVFETDYFVHGTLRMKKVFRGLPSPEERLDCAVAIGNFDGVHRGDQALLHEVVEAAHARLLCPAVLTLNLIRANFLNPKTHRAASRVCTIKWKPSKPAVSSVFTFFALTNI